MSRHFDVFGAQGLPELWLPLGGFASAKLRAEWRPLSTGTEGAEKGASLLSGELLTGHVD